MPVYTNKEALHILNYPQEAQSTVNPRGVQEQFRSIFQAKCFTAGLPPVGFLSGRRHYVCRPFSLESRDGSARPPLFALLLERRPRDPVELSEVSRRFHLSRRERETIQHLIQGLTTKEIAQRMSVSPNTIKQFVRLIMIKMLVTTRSGIIGKIVGT
jgi:DNA-binding CsgD family transcriptional regulator